MLLSQAHSRLYPSSRRQASVTCNATVACPIAIRQPVNVCRPLRPAYTVPQGPPRNVVAQAGRRGRPEEEPTPDIAEDELYLEDEQFEYEEGEDGVFEEELDDMSKRLIGIGSDDDDEAGELEEIEEDEDEGVLDEAAEADRDGAAADDVGEPSTSYPEPPFRAYRAADLFGEAELYDAALWLAARFPGLIVTGVQSNPHLVVPGDVFVLHPWLHPDETELEAIAVAVEKGSQVIVAPHVQQEPGLDPGGDPLAGRLPDFVALVRVGDPPAAGAQLASAFYKAPSRDLLTVGVIGLAGKTTTSWLIRGIVEDLNYTVGLMSSIEHSLAEDWLDEDGYLWEPLEEDPSEGRESSVPFKLLPYAGKYEQLYGDRLPGLNAQKMLAGMRDRGAKVAVMELGPQHLAVGTYDNVSVNVVVVTNITPRPAQPGQQQSPEMVAAARESVEVMCSTIEDKLVGQDKRVLVLNIDDPAADTLLRRLGGKVPVVTFGVANSNANVWAESIKSNIWETEVIINLRDANQRLQIITNLLGRHNVYNVLAAVATGVALQSPVTSIVAGVEAVEIPGRSEVIDEGQDFSVVVDAAREPEALGAMLDAIRQAGARQIFTVFGCSGSEDPSIRPKMGAVAHAKSDYVIITNENPRMEDPAQVVSDIVAGFPDDMINRYSAYAYFPFQDQGRTPLWFEPYLQKAQRDNKRYIMEDRYSAIRAAIGTAGPEDVVLLAGKGHEDWVMHMSEDGGLLRGWLDDRVEARNALSKLKYLNQIPNFNRDTLPWGTKIESMMETLTVDATIGRTGPVDTGAD